MKKWIFIAVMLFVGFQIGQADIDADTARHDHEERAAGRGGMWVTCTMAAEVVSDYARNWRDKGRTLREALGDLEAANVDGAISQIQMGQLRRDVTTAFEHPSLRFASGEDLAYAVRTHCPHEYVK